MTNKKSCGSANERGWKQSDQKKLGADALIIASLKDKQPQTIESICKSAGIDKSTFYRHSHILESSGLVKKVNGKYALWYYNTSPSLWDRLVAGLQKHRAPLISLEIEKLRLGDQDSITGWYEPIFDRKITVQGIIILKSANELKAASGVRFPEDSDAVLLTQGAVDLGDRFKWGKQGYVVKNFENVHDGYALSYRVFHLKTIFY